MPSGRTLPLLFLFTIVSAGFATPSVCATLTEAVDAAYTQARKQPLVAAFEHESAAVRRQAESLLAADPALSLLNLNDRLDQNRGYSEWELGLEVPLWLPGQRDARKREADAIGEQAIALSNLLRLETAGRVREAVWDHAIANGRVRLAQAALGSARDLESMVEKRFKAGELAKIDLLLARQETAVAESDLQQAKAQRQQAREHLRLLTGLETPVSPIDEQPAPEGTLDDTHPRLQLAANANARARAARERSRTEIRDNPTLSIGGKTQRDSRDRDYEHLLALEVRLPLGLSEQAAPKLARTERELTEKQVEYQRQRLELEQQIAAARLALAANRDAIDLAEHRQALAADGLHLSLRAFELGETGLLQLVQARQRALRAELNLALQRLELGRATARYNQAQGLMPQ